MVLKGMFGVEIVNMANCFWRGVINSWGVKSKKQIEEGDIVN